MKSEKITYRSSADRRNWTLSRDAPEMDGPARRVGPERAETFWNGEPCEARKVRVIVADNPTARLYWARGFVGQERDAVEVTYAGQTFYLDDEAFEETRPEDLDFYQRTGFPPGKYEAGSGWDKVTDGRGSPQWGHSNLEIACVVGVRA